MSINFDGNFNDLKTNIINGGPFLLLTIVVISGPVHKTPGLIRRQETLGEYIKEIVKKASDSHFEAFNDNLLFMFAEMTDPCVEINLISQKYAQGQAIVEPTITKPTTIRGIHFPKWKLTCK